MILRSPLHIRVLRRSFLLLILSFVTGAFAAPASFDIPAQSAPAALDLFIKQSGSQVVYLLADVADVRTNAVHGSYEPATALGLLLKDTVLTSVQRKPDQFSVGREVRKTGSIKGSLSDEGGQPVAGIQVEIRGTAQVTTTDRTGEYAFALVPTGTYMLLATSPDYQPLHIVDVDVPAGHSVILGKEAMHRPIDEVTKLQPVVVQAESVTELESYEVTSTKVQPFSGADVDIARTIDDAQPYYIFDSKTIEQSGATDIEDLLKQRLTMNTTSLTNAQNSQVNTYGNISSINLRGLGTNETLILVNGRRMAGVTVQGTDFQPDINGIPLNAIDRIEVLPSSASGIYGGSAIGGVINIILKKDYSGGELRATYDNTWDTDSSNRTIAANYGFSMEGGKTHVMLSGSWSDAQPLLLQDRRGIYEQNIATIQRNDPSSLAITTTPFLGSLPNIINLSGTASFSPYYSFNPNDLVLKDGTVLGSGITHIPSGTSGTTSSATLEAGLESNAGSFDLNPPLSTQSPSGLLQSYGLGPTTKAFQGSLNREFGSKLELFADFSYNGSRTATIYNPILGAFTVAPTVASNPFTTRVRIDIPDASMLPSTADSTNREFTFGAILHLPAGWTGEADYTWSQNRFQSLSSLMDIVAINTDIANGVLNPFVDTLRYPLNLQKYFFPQNYGSSDTLRDFAVRGSGSLWALPWGIPSLTFGLEHRVDTTPNNSVSTLYPFTTSRDTIITYFGQHSETDSGYAELTVPIVKKDWLLGVHALELQLSGRSERYTVDTGTSDYFDYPNDPDSNFYDGPTLNGLPYTSKTHYTSTNGTVGLKYQPLQQLTLRASTASAFLPPTPDQLVKEPQVDPYTTTVSDPKTGNFVDVQTISGGNPNLKPQSSKSFNFGAIWEPQWKPLQGLRFDAEYYRIDQDNAIGSLDAQTIVDLESTYPGRVTRDSSGDITLVDVSLLNLYKRETEGWDLSADYTLKTGIGTFDLAAAESIIMHLRNQYDQTLPDLDAVNFPSEDGAAKYKANATLTWDWHGWTASWTTLFYSSYKQYGAAGGPDSTEYYGGAEDDTYITAQGSNTIPSQTYHSLFLSYAFGKQRSGNGSRLSAIGASMLDGLTVQLGVRNIFNKIPPFDDYYSGNFYESPYGDLRLRTYWLSVKKTF